MGRDTIDTHRHRNKRGKEKEKEKESEHQIKKGTVVEPRCASKLHYASRNLELQ